MIRKLCIAWVTAVSFTALYMAPVYVACRVGGNLRAIWGWPLLLAGWIAVVWSSIAALKYLNEETS